MKITKSLILTGIILIVLFIWTFFIEPGLLYIKHYSLENKNLKGLKVVFIGDLHLRNHQEKRLNQIVTQMNKQKPDLILITGDFVNGHEEKYSLSIQTIAKTLSKLTSKYGIYTVLGNHDYWQNGEKIARELKKQKIFVLQNENIRVNLEDKSLYIAGVDDLWTKDIDLDKTLQGTRNPTILLSHSPDIFPLIPDTIDLTLAGHTHGGQVVLPFIGALIVPSMYGNKYAQGFINENNKTMIVTKGIGTSIIHARFNCLPEIIVIDFK